MFELFEKGAEAMNLMVDLMVESDAHYEPQALILAPEHVIKISKEIIKGSNDIDAAV